MKTLLGLKKLNKKKGEEEIIARRDLETPLQEKEEEGVTRKREQHHEDDDDDDDEDEDDLLDKIYNAFSDMNSRIQRETKNCFPFLSWRKKPSSDELCTYAQNESEALDAIRNKRKTIDVKKLGKNAAGPHVSSERASAAGSDGNEVMVKTALEMILGEIRNNPNSNVEVLGLSSNGIDEEGAELISEFLMYNTSVTELGLGLNKLRDAGVECLAKALEHNNSISSVNLCYNKITDKGALALDKMLSVNRHIVFLNLDGNRGISPDVLQSIQSKINENCFAKKMGLIPGTSFGYNPVLN